MQNQINDFLKNFRRVARGKNITLDSDNGLIANPDIKWLLNPEVSQNSIPEGKWKNVDTLLGTKEKTMLETAQKISLSQAISKFTKMLEEGIFDNFETYRIIFLKETHADGSGLELVCYRYSDGKLNLYAEEVKPEFSWDDCDCAWFEEENP